MPSKSFSNPQVFIVSALAVPLCCDPGVCWFVVSWDRKRRDSCRMNHPQQHHPVIGRTAAPKTGIQFPAEQDAYSPAVSQPDEEYPKVTSETESEGRWIDFTGHGKPEETPPRPEGKTEIADPGEDHDVNPDLSVKSSSHGAAGRRIHFQQ